MREGGDDGALLQERGLRQPLVDDLLELACLLLPDELQSHGRSFTRPPARVRSRFTDCGKRGPPARTGKAGGMERTESQDPAHRHVFPGRVHGRIRG